MAGGERGDSTVELGCGRKDLTVVGLGNHTETFEIHSGDDEEALSGFKQGYLGITHL